MASRRGKRQHTLSTAQCYASWSEDEESAGSTRDGRYACLYISDDTGIGAQGYSEIDPTP